MVKTINILNVVIIVLMVPIIATAKVSEELRGTAWLLLLAIVVLTVTKFHLWPKLKK